MFLICFTCFFYSRDELSRRSLFHRKFFRRNEKCGQQMSSTHPLEQAPLGSRLPLRSPSTSPLDVGLQGMLGYHPCPLHGQTYTCKHITLPQISFAGGNNDTLK